jgi:CTP synthase
MPTLLEEKGIMHYLANFVGVGSGPEYPFDIQIKGAKLWRSWTSAAGDAEQNIASDCKMPPTIISLIGNFTAYSHLSVTRSLEHAALSCHRRLQINFITASHLDPSVERLLPVQHVQALATLHSSHGILVPGGFGSEGTEGMIEAIRWARESRTPFLGICLGMQLTVIEFARNVCEMPKATSAEFVRSADIFDGEKLITYMPDFDRASPDDKMRLGVRKTYFQRDTEWSKARASYATGAVSEPDYLIAGGPSAFVIHERYRHRLAVNPKHFEVLETNGLRLVGKDDTGTRTGVVEIKDHPWFVGVQYHPEYTSKVMDPNRCILGFFKASSEGVPMQLLTTGMATMSLE